MEHLSAHPQIIIPLCTSSATLGLSLFQYPVFLSFLQKQQPGTTSSKSIAGAPLSRFWTNFMRQATPLVVGLGLTSVITGAWSWSWLQNHGHLETTAVSEWYGYGALFAIGHFASIPLIAGPVKRITDGTGDLAQKPGEDQLEESNRKDMASWLQWHTARTVLVDLPAVYCFACGVALASWIV